MCLHVRVVDTTWPRRWPHFFQRFVSWNLWSHRKDRHLKNGGLMARREKGKPDLKPFRLALVNEHCSHCWEGKWAVLHQKVWYHGHAADCQIVTCSWKEVLDILWSLYRDSRSQKWDRMEFIVSTSFCLELLSVHVVVLFPIRSTVTLRLFNTNLRKDYSLINGSTAVLATTFRGTLAVNYMSTNQIRAMFMLITYLAKRKCGSIEDFASCTWRSTLFWHLL